MKHVKWVVIGVLALSLTGVVLRAADEQKPADSTDKTTKTDTKDEKKPMAGGRLIQPYSKLTSLSDDQKDKILSIHKDYNAQRKELEKKERDEIMALLTDDQKKEVEKIEGEKKTTGTKKSGSDAKTSDAKTSDSSSTDKKE
jgi:Spy/CpxP family protein refolding chaperone